MVVRPASQRPVEFALRRRDRVIVDAGDPPAHQPVVIELPVFVAVGAEMLPAVVPPLVGEPNCDPIARERPQLLDQTVVQLTVPLPGEKRHDVGAPLYEFGAVSPSAVLAVSERDGARITAV